MADVVPLKVARDSNNNPSGISEFQLGDVVPASRGGTGVTSIALLGFALTGTDFDASSLNGIPIIGGPGTNQILLYNGSNWVPSSIGYPNAITSIQGATGAAINFDTNEGISITFGSHNDIHIFANYTSAIWNASALSGVSVSGMPTNNQILLYDGNAWRPSSISFPTAITSINSLNGPGVTISASGGASVSSGNNNILIGSLAKFSSSIGDGASTSLTVTHNLGTQDFLVNVYSVASPFTQIRPTIKNTSTTQATLEFTVAPTTDQYRVVIIG